MSTEAGSRRRAIGHACAAAVAFTAVALWVTRPLATHLFDHSLVAFPYTAFDIPLNAWILSWVSRALATQPWALFDANIYHPEPAALAYTEHMLGSVPFFAPTFLATGNPALALNVMILAGLTLSALGTYWVTWRWTGSWAAAAFAGLVVGFQATQVRALGPNLQTTQYLPIVLLLLDRVLAGGGLLATVGLAAALTGQSLASYYYAYPTMLATAAAAAVACIPRDGRPSRAALVRVGFALLVAAGVLVAVSQPYFRVGASRSDTIFTMARLTEETATRVGQLAALLAERPGLPAAALAVVGACAAALRGADPILRRRVLVLVTWVAVGLVLTIGPTLGIGPAELPMPDRLLDRWAPGFAALRDRRRLFVVAPVALGVLAGLGIVALARTRARPRIVTAALAFVALAATAARANLGPCRLMALPTRTQAPPVYRELAAREVGPVLELPVGVTLKDVPSASQNTWYEYFSIFHWRPLVNGYASYWPPQLDVTLSIARGLPAPHALGNLVDCTGVRWIVAHTERMTPRERAAFEAVTPGLRPLGRFGADLLFEITTPRPPGACVDRLRRSDVATTIEGTPLAPLDPAARRAALERVDAPAELPPAQRPNAVAVPVRLRNTGTAVWPAVALDRTHLVQLSYAWLDAAGNPVAMPWRFSTRLPVDLRPGEAVDVPVAVRPPPRAGNYRLAIIVQQGLQGGFHVSGPAADPVPVLVR